MRGGAARGLSAGAEVFRVRRVGDIALLVVQWALVLSGLGGLAFSTYLYLAVPYLVYPTAQSSAGENVFQIDMRFTVLVQGITFSLVSIGLGALLFYLRHIYLSRRQ